MNGVMKVVSRLKAFLWIGDGEESRKRLFLSGKQKKKDQEQERQDHPEGEERGKVFDLYQNVSGQVKKVSTGTSFKKGVLLNKKQS